MSQEFTKDNFDNDVLIASKEKLALVDFYASWCGPCKLQGPIIDELAEKLKDKVIIGKINTENEPELAEKYGIMSIPSIILFKDGQPVETIVGLNSRESLMTVIEKYL